jgi:short-subunit dehydrogenase
VRRRTTRRAGAALGRVGSAFDRAGRATSGAVRRARRVARGSPTLEGTVGGRMALITGASSGIGRAAALRLGGAGATVLLVARTRERLDEVAAEIGEAGGTAHVHPCDLSISDDVERMAAEVLERHAGVDILVNNAGRSIRRSIALSYDRLHDFERTIQLNYIAPVSLILKLLPGMRERKSGHIINISSIGVQTNTPRFSAYVASKAALDAFSRSIASEIIGDGVRITTIHMPLVRTPMIEPTRFYKAFPAITPEEAAAMITDAIIDQPKRVATPLGNLGQLAYALSPSSMDAILHRAYLLFPDSKAARGDKAAQAAPGREAKEAAPGFAEEVSEEGRAFAEFTRGVHW